jgi:hypothetical protein
MSIVANTFQTYDAIGQREDLANIIYDISPTDTPFMSNGGKGSMSAVTHEWQTDSLAAVDTANAQLESDDITSFPAVDPTVRVGNYAQISRKLVIISGTLDAVDKAGRNTELAYQLAKRSAELKRDMESIALENIGAVAGGATTARQMATLGAWVKTNVSKGTGGGDPAYTSGVPGAARTDATTGDLRAFSETLFKTVLQSIWSNGGNLKFAMAGPVNKQNMSEMAGTATQTYFQSAAEATKIIGAADVYVSDFGTVSLVANRFQRERDVWLIDPDFYSFNYLRSFRQEKLAKTGDAEKRQMLVEWTLKVRNEAALGLVADCNSTVQ